MRQFFLVVRYQFPGHLLSLVFIIVTIDEVCSHLYLTTKQKSDYLLLCNPFPLENSLNAGANYKSNINFSEPDWLLSERVW